MRRTSPSPRGPNVTPHITKNEKGRRSNFDGRTTRHPSYGISLMTCRWLVERASNTATID
jgi:hypothetical protein